MGEKSVQKKKLILETARKVFMEKGFKKVTMKDIVEACGISRGGLYLYFDSTSQIFLEVMKLEREEADDVFSLSIKEDATAADILLLFLMEQKKELLRKNNTLTHVHTSVLLPFCLYLPPSHAGSSKSPSCTPRDLKMNRISLSAASAVMPIVWAEIFNPSNTNMMLRAVPLQSSQINSPVSVPA